MWPHKCIFKLFLITNSVAPIKHVLQKASRGSVLKLQTDIKIDRTLKVICGPALQYDNATVFRNKQNFS